MDTDIVGGIHANEQTWGSKQCPLKMGELYFASSQQGCAKIVLEGF